MKPGRYAALDIGTVTCRLLVADVDEVGLTELAKGYRITNLGEGVDASGVLLPQAMDRVCAAVAEFQEQIASLEEHSGSIPLTALATSASRDAQNADEFQSRMERQGVPLTVIPGQREAYLTFRGACCGFEGQQVLVVDSGGGSTEVVAGVAGQQPAMSHSIDVGCRRVTERCLHHDPPLPEEIAAAREWISREMGPCFQQLRENGLLPAKMIAVAGTATSVVSVHLAMAEYDSSRVQGFEVSGSCLDGVLTRLASVSVEERRRVVGLDPGRAPVIVAGLLILQTVLELAGCDGYTASESDILQGIILDAAGV